MTQLSPGRVSGWSHHCSHESQPCAAAPRSPFLPCLGTDVSMLPLPCGVPEGRDPECMGLPGLRVKGAGQPLGPWVQPLGELFPSLQKCAEQPETSGVPWPLLHTGSSAKAVRVHSLLHGCKSSPGTAQGSPALPTWQ